MCMDSYSGISFDDEKHPNKLLDEILKSVDEDGEISDGSPIRSHEGGC